MNFFCLQNPNGARIMEKRKLELEQGFLETEHTLGKVAEMIFYFSLSEKYRIDNQVLLFQY